MVLDSISPASNSKKRRSKKTAKLKQTKLDARRKQWVSQVMNHGPKVEAGGVREMLAHNGMDQAIGVSEITRNNTENDALLHNYSDSDLSSNSRSSHIECVAGSNCSGTNFSGSSWSSSTNSCTSYSGNLSDKEEDGSYDNWEALADALASTADKKEQHDRKLKSPVDDTYVAQFDPVPKVVDQPATSLDVPKAKPVNRQAWRPDDAFRPGCLPSLVKQNTFPMQPNKKYAHEGPVWIHKNVVSGPSMCPICCEDLDVTDLSFLPCSCGFQLCLFCHKMILEEDGRCPGCRKPYESDAVRGEGFQN